jgi:hypothetical protein
VGSISRKITVQAGPGINERPYSKIISAKGAEGVAQVVEHLPGSTRPWVQTPVLQKKKKKKK